jgi:iron(III) transport system ATP-binding protein
MLGRTSLIHLSPLGATAQDPHLHARIPGRFLPREDELLQVSLDRSQTFVFPLESIK